MSFAKALARLKVETQQPSRGRGELVGVRVDDLRDLLYHFHRLDEEVRARHRAEHPEAYPPGIERS